MANTYSDRLKLRMPAAGDVNWDDEINDNALILEVAAAASLQGNRVLYGVAPSDGGGLLVDYAAGVVEVAGSKHTIAASNKTCTANVKNWLYVDNAGAMQISTTPPTGDYVPIALVDAGAAAIDRIGDLRPMTGTYRQSGSSTFNGQTGRQVSISPAVVDTDYQVLIEQQAESGLVGEIHIVSKTTNQFTVKNSGADDSTAFDWTMFKY